MNDLFSNIKVKVGVVVAATLAFFVLWRRNRSLESDAMLSETKLKDAVLETKQDEVRKDIEEENKALEKAKEEKPSEAQLKDFFNKL
jgi:uncharacterized membrane protein YgaE (UPF0421/DUF939 family)